MKNFFLNLLISGIVLSFVSCAYAEKEGIVEEERIVAPFHKISVSSGINLVLTQENEHQVVVEADGSVMDRVEIDSKNGNLSVSFNSQGIWFRRVRPGKINVYVSFTRLNSLSVSSGANAVSTNPLQLEDFEVNGSSGARCSLSLDCSDIDVHASSGANINLSGTAVSLFMKASSGANISAGELYTVNAQVNASSGANIKFNASGDVETSASSGANIIVFGQADLTTVKQSSGGSVTLKN